MKNLVISIALVSGSGAFATSFSEAEQKCARGVYCVEQMVCLGKIKGQPPTGMHSDYYVEILALRSAKTVKNAPGGKTLVDTLMMNDTPAGDTPDITLKEAKEKADFEYGQYGAPARIRGNRVATRWTTLGFSRGLSLIIQSSTRRDNTRLDTLTGSEKIAGSTVGDYEINYECEATVVEAPSMLIDQTRP